MWDMKTFTKSSIENSYKGQMEEWIFEEEKKGTNEQDFHRERILLAYTEKWLGCVGDEERWNQDDNQEIQHKWC